MDFSHLLFVVAFVLFFGYAIHPRREGLKIISVFPGTSAEVAGLRKGDLITAIDGVPVHERGCADPEGEIAGQRRVLTYLREHSSSVAAAGDQVTVIKDQLAKIDIEQLGDAEREELMSAMSKLLNR